jgi:HSP20 family protein
MNLERPQGQKDCKRRNQTVTNLTRWDPFGDLRTTMDRLFDEGFSRPWRLMPAPAELEATFPLEVSETEDAIEVKGSLPGVKPEDVEISVANGVLTVKAEHRETTEDKKRDFYRREIRYGSFHRAISLPVSVDADKAEARFENGLLHLTLPKAEAIRPKQIKIGSGPTVVNGGN